MRTAFTALLTSTALACSTSATAGVVLTDYFGISTNSVSDFQDVAGSAGVGINYDGVIVSGGVSYAEHFAGQTVSFSGDFDVLTNTDFPFGLFLQTGEASRNLSVFTMSGGNNVLAGVGPVGHPYSSAVGEGAIAALFQTDQSAFGFQILGGNLGTAYVSVFDSNGVVIDELTLGGLANQSYGFQHDGTGSLIRGFTVHTDDPFGIVFDNVIFNQNGVPEPATWALLLLGFGVIGAGMRAAGNRRLIAAAA